MKLYDSIAIAANSIIRAKTFFLANAIAITIGVFLIITMLSIAFSIRKYIEDQFSKEVSTLAIEVHFDPRTQHATPISFGTIEDFRKIPGVNLAFPHYLGIFADIILPGQQQTLISLASLYSEQDPELARLEVLGGKSSRLFELVYGIIIPANVATDLGTQSPEALVGKDIKLELTRIMAEKREIAQINAKVAAVVKETRYSRCYGSIRLLHLITLWQEWKIPELPKIMDKNGVNNVKTWKNTRFDTAIIYAKKIDEIESIQETIKRMGYKTVSLFNLIKKYREISFISIIVLGSLGAISLFTGSISIFNTAFASVVRRTREIGIYKAIGASSFEILSIFLWEAIITALLAGCSGYLIAIGFVWFANHTFSFFQGIPFLVSNWWLFLTAQLVALTACIIASIIPARKAARLNVVEALRYE